MNRGDLTNAQWERLQPLLPPQKPTTGHPAPDHRTILNGSLWVLRTGAPWRDLPERYGPWRTMASRFYRGGKKGDPEAEALGRSQGGFSTRVHLRADGNGKLLTLLLTPGQRHEAVVFPHLMASGGVERSGRGRPKHRPHRIVADKGYGSRKIRQHARHHGMRITIPRKANEGRKGRFDRALYRQRNWIERLVNRCKQFRRLATRYEKRARYYKAMWLMAATLLWLACIQALQTRPSVSYLARGGLSR